MDLATLLGLIGGLAFVVMAMILGGSIMMFVDVTSILIVVGGSIFVVLMKFTMGQFFGAAKIAGKAFMFKADEP
ncbi:flagellar motor protein PomA, partial [Vibrio vulnificus]|nr:flagellar motor protein PomA [Vibrio vulnificus]